MILPSPRTTCRCLAAGALVLALAGPAFAQGTEEQREACTPDALKLCSDTIPDVAKTTACMKLHEAALSPRCRAVFDVPAASGAAVTAAHERGERPTDDRKSARRETAAREVRDEPSRHHSRSERASHRQRPERDATRPTDLAPGDGGGDFADDRGASGPGYGNGGPDIRYFPPGDNPDAIDAAEGIPPYGDDRYDGRPSPRGWDDPRFADRGPAYGPDGSGPDRYDGANGPHAPIRRGDGGARDEDGRPPGHGPHRAQAVIARLCADGEIDPRTCAVTERALGRQRRD